MQRGSLAASFAVWWKRSTVAGARKRGYTFVGSMVDAVRGAGLAGLGMAEIEKHIEMDRGSRRMEQRKEPRSPTTQRGGTREVRAPGLPRFLCGPYSDQLLYSVIVY